MKNILLFTVMLLLFSACSNSEPNKNTNKEEYMVYSNEGMAYRIVTIDSCEYLRDMSGNLLEHKGNCKYCIERPKNFNKKN